MQSSTRCEEIADLGLPIGGQYIRQDYAEIRFLLLDLLFLLQWQIGWYHGSLQFIEILFQTKEREVGAGFVWENEELYTLSTLKMVLEGMGAHRMGKCRLRRFWSHRGSCVREELVIRAQFFNERDETCLPK